MPNYAILDNRTNKVLEIVDWDGVSAGPERAIDTTMHELPDGVLPTVGQLWNGTVFVDDPNPPVDEPEAESEHVSRAAERKRSRKSDDD